MGKYRLEYWARDNVEIPTIADEDGRQLFLDLVDGQPCLVTGFPGEAETYHVVRRFKTEAQADATWDKLFDWLESIQDVSLKRICQRVNVLMNKPRMAM